MKAEAFLTALERALRRLPREERQEALDYYRDYLTDAGPEREEEVIAALGDPRDVAAQIIRETAEQAVNPKRGSAGKKPLKAVWLTILGVCASPVALPLLIVAVVLIAVLLICVAALLLAVLALALSCAAGGLQILVLGVPVLAQSAANGLVVLGIGLALIGFGILFWSGFWYGGKYAIRGSAKLIHTLFGPRKRRKETI